MNVYEKALRRDGGLCVICGRAAGAVHHCAHRSAALAAVNALHNLASLCLYHHDEAHKHPKRYTAALLALLAKRYGYVYGSEFRQYLVAPDVDGV